MVDVRALGPPVTARLTALRADSLVDCVLISGPIEGSVLLHGATGCAFALAARQARGARALRARGEARLTATVLGAWHELARGARAFAAAVAQQQLRLGARTAAQRTFAMRAALRWRGVAAARPFASLVAHARSARAWRERPHHLHRLRHGLARRARRLWRRARQHLQHGALVCCL